jgi:ATP-binding cassette subfamily B protein
MCGLFKDEYHGVILYDSLEQKELNIEKMNEYMISICEQDPYLFDGTINENLCCKTKKEKRADLRRLLIDFGLFDKINSLDNKFETQISSLNTILSGGEKQKIAIIRTLISDGDVLIFDEPLSALDKKSKIVFQEEISKIKDKIVIIISHEELKKIKKNIVLIKLAPKEENEI